MKESEGTATMKQIAQFVREGAMAYLKQQYKVVVIVFIVLAALFALLALILGIIFKVFENKKIVILSLIFFFGIVCVFEKSIYLCNRKRKRCHSSVGRAKD